MLNQQQQQALHEFLAFMAKPDEEIFILEGPAGTGKSYLVQHILDAIPAQIKTIQLLSPGYKGKAIAVTATTNKAVDALRQFVPDVSTIHSLLGLKVSSDVTTGDNTLVERRGAGLVENTLIFIDEASFIDSHLLGLIFKRTKNCKYVFIGDPYQLTPVKSTSCPAFQLSGIRVHLTEIVRNKGNQIEVVSGLLKKAVATGTLEPFKADGVSIFLMNPQDFEEKIREEFTHPDWNESKAKIIAWTNKTVIEYGKFVNSLFNGVPHFIPGNYATVNSYIANINGQSYATDQTVQITSIEPDLELAVPGSRVILNHQDRFFLPDDWRLANKVIKDLRATGQYNTINEIEKKWIDLRPAPSCTINKSQGSTYEKVFIDYDDVIKCRQPDLLYRLLYVAVSRAKTHVYFKRRNN